MSSLRLPSRFEMRWRLAKGKRRPRMGILVSQYDHCLADLLYRHKAGELDCDIPLVISNHTDAERLAGFYGAKFVHTPVTRETKAGGGAAADCDAARAGVRRGGAGALHADSFAPRFVAEFPNQVINIHHSFLPAFVGARPYHQAFERGVKLIGATSHYVTEVLDDGPIIEQAGGRASRTATRCRIWCRRDATWRRLCSRAPSAGTWKIACCCMGRKTVVFD